MKRGALTVIGLTAFALLAGDRVRILSDGATTRVTH